MSGQEADLSNDETHYPCTFPATNHEALIDNLRAIVIQRDEARAEVERLHKGGKSNLEHCMKLAELAAESQGKQFLVGVRPYDKGWFAHCDGVEWDGSSPGSAILSVVEALTENAKRASLLASSEAKTLAQRVEDLNGVLDLAITASLLDE